MNTALVSKILTFLSGCAGTVATYGVVDAGAAMDAAKAGVQHAAAMPQWLVILCIVLTGGFAKASIGALPTNQKVVIKEDGEKPANGG